jgi:hypothetical protein
MKTRLLPVYVDWLYHGLKWALLTAVFSIFAANITAPIGAIVLFILGGFGLLLAGVVWLAAVIGMMWMVWRSGRRTRQNPQPHARHAAFRAGQHPHIEVIDIGLKLSERFATSLLRDEALPDDIAAITPTVKFWLKRSYYGTVSFEFYDEYGEHIPSMTRRQKKLLYKGMRQVTLKHSIPLPEQLPEGIWQMRVRLGSELFAVHEIEWHPTDVVYEDEPDETFQYPHAQEAAQWAGGYLLGGNIVLTDIGMLATDADDNQRIHQTEPISIDAQAVQPYIRLYVGQRAEGTVQFMLFDENGVKQYTYREKYLLQTGDNLIAAGTRFPLELSPPLDAKWQLQVMIGETVVANHHIKWQDETVSNLPITNDGEINTNVRLYLRGEGNQRVSLDDLLNEAPPNRQRRR